MRCRVARLTNKRLCPGKCLTLGRQGKCDLMAAHLCEVVFEHLIGEQFENILTAEIHIAAESKLLDDEFPPPVLRHIFHAEIKVRRSAAEIEYAVGNLLAHALRLKSVCLKRADRICRRLIRPVINAETAHHLGIIEQRFRQALPKSALEALANMLANTLFISHGEGKNIVQVDTAMHIVDVKAEIVSIDLDRIKSARVEGLRLRIRLDLLDIAASIFQDR